MARQFIDFNNRHFGILAVSHPAPGVQVSVERGSRGPYCVRVRRAGYITGQWEWLTETKAREEFERKVKAMTL